MTDVHPHGTVTAAVVDDRILVITVDRVDKKNAFTPRMIGELAAALTRLDDDPDLLRLLDLELTQAGFECVSAATGAEGLALARDEGPGVVASFVASHPDFELDPPGPSTADPRVAWDALVDDAGTITLWPDQHGTDGFFVARLRRAS